LNRIKNMLFIIILLGFCNSVAAEEYTNYLGASLGQSSINLSGYDQAFFYKLYAGTRKKHYGFEGSYNRLAKFDLSGNNSGSVSASGIEAAGIIFLPTTNNLELFVKLGFISWSATGKINGGFVPQNNGNDLTYSVGAQYEVADKIKLRAEYQWFRDVIGGDLTSVSTGISYRF